MDTWLLKKSEKLPRNHFITAVYDMCSIKPLEHEYIINIYIYMCIYIYTLILLYIATVWFTIFLLLQLLGLRKPAALFLPRLQKTFG